MAKPQRLLSIEALRGIAASLVVAYHVARHVNKAFPHAAPIGVFAFGHAGVDIFFVLSGFIILFVHRRDIGQPGRLPHYLWRRFTRVWPTYWVALLASIALELASGHGWPPWNDVLWSFTLLPGLFKQVLGVAWTMQFEIVFYGVFAVLILNRRAGLILLAAWAATVAAQWAGVWHPVHAGAKGALVPNMIYESYNLEFWLGMVVALQCRVNIARPRIIAIAGAALFCAAAIAENRGLLYGYGNAARCAYGAAASVLVLGLVQAEQAGVLIVPRLLQILGAASYTIYLFQFVFIGLAWHLCLASGQAPRLAPWACAALLAAAGLAGGVGMHFAVERRLLAVFRRQGAPRIKEVEWNEAILPKPPSGF